MLKNLIIALCLLIAPASLAAQDIEGSWDFRVAGTTIFRFEIAENPDGTWQGAWSRPDSFASDGNQFAQLRGPVERIESMAGYEFLGNVELSFDDPRPGAVPDIFRFSRVGPDELEMAYVGTDLEPYTLVRADEGEPLGGWDEGAVFRRPLPAEEEETDFRVRETNPDVGPDIEPDVGPDVPLWRLRPAGPEAGSPSRAQAPTRAEMEAEPDDAKDGAPQIDEDFLDGI